MEIKMVDITCPQCGIVFAITAVHDSNLRECHNTFYCPSGHSQSYPQKTEAEKLRVQLADKERSLEYFRKLEKERTDKAAKKLEAKLKKQRAERAKAKKGK